MFFFLIPVTSQISCLCLPLIGNYTTETLKKNIQKQTQFQTILSSIQSQILIQIYSDSTCLFQFIWQGKFGIDGISLWLVWQVSILMPIVLLSTEKSVEIQPITMLILLILIGFWSNAVFLSQDLQLFYLSFEGVQIPMFQQIGFYGGRNRKIHAAYQFFLYTQFGSLFFLIAQILLYSQTGTTDYQLLLTYKLDNNIAIFIWICFFLAQAIKVPMIPAHIWLPEAHVEAPTAASVLQAAILQKQGSYGMLRYLLGLFPEQSKYMTPFIAVLCTLGIIFSSVACQALWDMKKQIAYSSIGHMNTATLAIFTNDIIGISASIFFLISHGQISSGQFQQIGILYDRFHTRTIKYFKGLVQILPVFTTFFQIFTQANIAVPGTSGFVSEFLTFLATFQMNPTLGLLASSAILLAPAYSQWFFHRISYGSISNHQTLIWSDCSKKEYHLLFPLIFLTLILGIYPSYIQDTLLITVGSLVSI